DDLIAGGVPSTVMNREQTFPTSDSWERGEETGAHQFLLVRTGSCFLGRTTSWESLRRFLGASLVAEPGVSSAVSRSREVSESEAVFEAVGRPSLWRPLMLFTKSMDPTESDAERA